MRIHSALALLLVPQTIARPNPKPVIPKSEQNRAYQDFAGIATFAHLPHLQCLYTHHDVPLEYDVVVMGVPFDSAVSFRPGARFGPSAIRSATKRYSYEWGWDPNWTFNPFTAWAKLIDCGDVAPAFSDNAVALKQIERAYNLVLSRGVYNAAWNPTWLRGKPRVMTLGGDHTVLLPALRALHRVHGKITLVHFDSHIDTWDPEALGGEESVQEGVNHGTVLFHAAKEGLLAPTGNLHVGIRNKLTGKHNFDTDASLGFATIFAKEVDAIGVAGIVERIRKSVGNALVYLSVDIDVLDPAFAPATGTPEVGGFTTREFKAILQGLRGLRVVGADVVEVSPAYDTNAELTGLAAAEVAFDMLSLMVSNGLEPEAKQEL